MASLTCGSALTASSSPSPTFSGDCYGAMGAATECRLPRRGSRSSCLARTSLLEYKSSIAVSSFSPMHPVPPLQEMREIRKSPPPLWKRARVVVRCTWSGKGASLVGDGVDRGLGGMDRLLERWKLLIGSWAPPSGCTPPWAMVSMRQVLVRTLSVDSL
jgi:hypothetical protein